jgi:hypothetical protein
VKYPAIPAPTLDPKSLRDSILATKQAFEIHSHQSGPPLNAAVTWSDLVALGLITAAQVPLK